ncbi:tetratricopeptide repeat protein [Streptomyces sp. NPDC091281]|uniref:tetratricopeptide repeat protein n=1 Tax=Streptomyces sp. NPDC091281 TaxID=3365985 RepID=UPI0037F9F727
MTHAHENAQVHVAGRDVHHTVTHTTAAPVPEPSMYTLPRGVAAFTGRESELRRLVEVAASPGLVAIHSVSGMPGVGKTALVTHAARLLADRFPDGQLFVSLHAHTPGRRPADPGLVLTDLLLATGMAAQRIPSGFDARVRSWRSRLVGRKILLVLDDAADGAQVEPLLPGTDGCLVMVTSRRRLIDLDGACPVPLDTLSPEQAERLFLRLSGRDTEAAGAGAVAELVRLCGYLPLAVTLLAGRLAHHPAWSLSRFVTDFVEARDRLERLRGGDRTVAAAFDLSYRDLPADRRRFFRHLGHHPGTDLDVDAAAALGGVSRADAERHLDALYTDHLLEERAPGRYGRHDLIRAYALALAADDPVTVSGGAIERLLDHYGRTAEDADRFFARTTRPGASPAPAEAGGPGSPARVPATVFPTRDHATAWLRGERGNFLACIDAFSPQARYRSHALRITAAAAAFLHLEGPWPEAAALHRGAADIARRGADPLAEANAHNDLGRVLYRMGDLKAAAEAHERALALYEDLGHGQGTANALSDLGRTHYLGGRYATAAALQERAHLLYRDAGDRGSEGNALWELGRVRAMTGEPAAATALHERALALFREVGDRIGEGNALWDLGRSRAAAGAYVGAAETQEEALVVFRSVGSRFGEANALHHLGLVRHLTGYDGEATRLQESALAIYRDLGNRQGEANALHGLGRVCAATGRLPEARDRFERALAIYRAVGSSFGMANSLHGLGRVRHLSGDLSGAAGLLDEALGVLREIGSLRGEAELLNSMGALTADSAGASEALAHYRSALLLARRLASPIEEGRALEGMAHCLGRTGDRSAARAALREAVGVYRRIGAAEAASAAATLEEY